METQKFYSVTTIISDLEQLLLRKLTVYHKQLALENQEPVETAIQKAKQDWDNWSSLSKKSSPPKYISNICEYLNMYLQSQMKAQIAENLVLDPKLHKDNLIKFISPDDDQHKVLTKRLDQYQIKVRCFPSYMPDMDTMCSYTLRAFSSQQNKLESRELIEAINQKFFTELMLNSKMLEQLSSHTPSPVIFEVSLPKPKESTEIFVRAWQNVEISENVFRWQVGNCSVPVKQIELNRQEAISRRWIEEQDSQISSIDSLNLKFGNASQSQIAMSKLVVGEEGRIDKIMKLLNDSFEFSLHELHKTSEFIYIVIQKYINAVSSLLNNIVTNLSNPFINDIDQKWSQLINSILMAINGSKMNLYQFSELRVAKRGRSKSSQQTALGDHMNLFKIDPIATMIENANLERLIIE